MVCFHAVVNAALFVHVNVISVYGEQIQFQIVKCHTVGFFKNEGAVLYIFADNC